MLDVTDTCNALHSAGFKVSIEGNRMFASLSKRSIYSSEVQSVLNCESSQLRRANGRVEILF